ncbi:MAG TPA: hypothetical protein VH165_35320 [Kofleriaceae bacterium]|jgi:hypothetical protein|nr:hypothetical protein [Kofleriaceae bacterium]
MIAAVSLHPGCSFLFVSGPPADHARRASFDCSESNAVPVLDTIWAGLNALGAISATGDGTNPNQGEIVAVGVGWLVVSGISAIYGYSQVSQCKKAKQEREDRYANSVSPDSTPDVPSGPAPAAVPRTTAAPGAMDRAPAVRTAPATTPPASSVRAREAAPAASGAAPPPHEPPGSTSPSPSSSSSLLPARSRTRAVLPVRPDVRAEPARSLAMRPAPPAG